MTFYRPPTNQGTLYALGTVYRALRAWKFYPKGHPSRQSSLELAYAAIMQLLEGNTLSLACGRTGFSFPDGEFIKDASGLSTALAYELFIRRVQKITFCSDLFQEDLLELFKILRIHPDDIQQAGGTETIMSERGIRTIWINEFDLAAIRGKRRIVEQSGVVPSGKDDADVAGDVTPIPESPHEQATALSPEEQLQKLLGRMAVCADSDGYKILARQAVACADIIRSQDPGPLFPLLELLASHSIDETRSDTIREYARIALEHIVSNTGLLKTILDRMDQGSGVSEETLLAVLKAGGSLAVSAAIELMGSTSSIKTRKMLLTMLGSMGEAAVPPLLNLIRDPRWFIIRNICTILGAIASREALPALARCLVHSDLRVRKEAIRSLALLGGQEAEAAIVSILRGVDAELYPQAIALLGAMKSKNSLGELMKIVASKDYFLKTLPLKLDALTAIAHIGERQVAAQLLTLLDERHLLAIARGRQLKAAIVTCLGKLGDSGALPAIRKLAANGGELGAACRDAIVLIEKTEGKAYGKS